MSRPSITGWYVQLDALGVAMDDLNHISRGPDCRCRTVPHRRQADGTVPRRLADRPQQAEPLRSRYTNSRACPLIRVHDASRITLRSSITMPVRHVIPAVVAAYRPVTRYVVGGPSMTDPAQSTRPAIVVFLSPDLFISSGRCYSPLHIATFHGVTFAESVVGVDRPP